MSIEEKIKIENDVLQKVLDYVKENRYENKPDFILGGIRAVIMANNKSLDYFKKLESEVKNETVM